MTSDRTRVDDSLRRFAAGRVIAGRYRIVSLRGVGGMGLVYEAHDDELGITIALKVIRPELAADPALIDRFRRELLLGRQVSHPNVVRIHDIGQDGSVYFLTMDHVDGTSLRGLLQERGRLDEAQVETLLRPIADALATAHRAGVVHRDLKPSNILVDSSGNPHISDFGLARSLSVSRVTQDGAVVGTPDYLSPEQARGETVDARSDIYALGVIVFEMLSGELPFTGGSLAETLAQRIAGRPRDLAQLGIYASPGMQRIVTGCLAASPAKRFQSASDLLAALDTPARPAMSRGMRHALATAAVVLAAIGLGAVAWRFRGPAAPAAAAAPAASIAVLPLRDETGTPGLAWMAGGIPEMLAETLAASPRLRVVDAERVRRTLADLKLDAGGWTKEELQRIGRLLDVESLVVGSARSRGSVLRVDAQLVHVAGGRGGPMTIAEEAGTPAALVRAIGADVTRGLDVPAPAADVALTDSPAALAAFHRAGELLSKGDAVLAEPALSQAVAADPKFGAAWYALARALDTLGQKDRATEAIDRAVAVLGEGGRLGTLAAARQASLRGDPDRAQQLLGRLVEQYPGDVDSAIDLAEAYGQAGRLTEARQVLEKVVAATPNHPRAYYLLGKYTILAGESKKAVDDYLVRALVVNDSLGSQQGRADVLNAFGVAYRELGDLARAQDKYKEAAEIRRQIGDRRGTATTLRNLAQIQTAQGQSDAAAATLASAIAIFDALGDKAGRADAVNDLGVMEEGRGNYRQALDHYREALQIRKETGDRRAEAESLNNVGYANQLLGDPDNASVYWHQALALYRETGNREGEILVTQSLGQLQLSQGHWDDAVKSYLGALERSRESEMLPASAVSLGYLGRLAQYQGRYAAALASYDEGLKVLAGLKDERGLAEFTLARADTLIELGLLDEAKTDLGAAAAWVPEGSNHEQRAEWLRLTAVWQARKGEGSAAKATLARAHEEAKASQSAQVLLKIDIDMGLSLLAERRDAEAARSLQTALQRSDKLGDAWLRLSAGEALARACLRSHDAARAERVLASALRLADACGSYSGMGRLYRLRATAERARGDATAAAASLGLASRELKRMQQGLTPARAGALEKTVAEETS